MLFEAIRQEGLQTPHVPRVVFTSSVAVFGAPVPDAIPDDFVLAPLTSYGTQKAIGELLLADYSRRGFLDGIGLRLPTICIRPGLPNRAASGFFSSILREPLVGRACRAAGVRRCAPLAREPTRRHRLPAACGGAGYRAARCTANAVLARVVGNRRRADRSASAGLQGKTRCA